MSHEHLPPPDHIVVSTVQSDRLCTACGYNLFGQVIAREPHYQLLIARCPECGTATAMQEYPRLGRWAGRWAMLVAALWFLFLLAFTFATAGTTVGLSVATAEIASRPYAQYLSEQYQQSKTVQSSGGRTTTYTWFDDDWWLNQDPDAILASAGGWRGIADVRALRFWGWFFLALVPLGCAWAVFLVHIRRRWFIVPALGILLIAAAIAIFTDILLDPATMRNTSDIALEQVGRPFIYASIVFALLPLMIGMFLGRRLVRGLMFLLLPPRLRTAMSMLWTSDGLAPPRATTALET